MAFGTRKGSGFQETGPFCPKASEVLPRACLPRARSPSSGPSVRVILSGLCAKQRKPTFPGFRMGAFVYPAYYFMTQSPGRTHLPTVAFRSSPVLKALLWKAAGTRNGPPSSHSQVMSPASPRQGLRTSDRTGTWQLSRGHTETGCWGSRLSQGSVLSRDWTGPCQTQTLPFKTPRRPVTVRRGEAHVHPAGVVPGGSHTAAVFGGTARSVPEGLS